MKSEFAPSTPHRLHCTFHRAAIFAYLALVAATLYASPAATATPPDSPAWNPSVTEKLVKLPNDFLIKALDRDFSTSPLAEAIRSSDQKIALKVETLQDLRAATQQAEGEVLVELRHQLLADKRQYLELIKIKQKLRAKHLKTRVRFYKRLFKKTSTQAIGNSKDRAALIERQTQARERFKLSVDKVDMKLFASPVAPQSRYSTEYTKNFSAAKVLLAAIEAHPMNAKLRHQGKPVSKPSYLRHLIADAEAELALINQEKEIIGYMAKIVSLDAMALIEEVKLTDTNDETSNDSGANIASTVELFTN